MRFKVKVEGLRELDRALSELPKSLHKGVMTRVLRKAAQPIAEAARSLAPRDTGELSNSISISTRVANSVGAQAFREVLATGGSRGEATKALRSARRAAKGSAPQVSVYVGPAKATTKRNAIKRIVQEFGSRNQAARAYMRPAWDSKSGEALNIVKREMGDEITRAAQRLAKRQARKKAKVT